MYLKSLIFILIAFMCISVSFINNNAEARIGGGRSFGGRPYMSRPMTKPLPTTQTTRQQATTQGLQQNTSTPFLGGMGGLFGGLVAGSLIGSLFLGNGFSGGSFLDLIILVGILYISFKFFFRKKVEQPNSTIYTATTAEANPSTTLFNGTGWEALQTDHNQTQTYFKKNIPVDFNEEEFLTGAKATYIRLNTSWDERNINDIAQFATPAFMKEIEQQYKDDPTPSKTEIILINASIVEVKNIQEKTYIEEVASVYFSVLLRETKNQETPIEIQEIWHFIKHEDGLWKLDGIQQVEHN